MEKPLDHRPPRKATALPSVSTEAAEVVFTRSAATPEATPTVSGSLFAIPSHRRLYPGSGAPETASATTISDQALGTTSPPDTARERAQPNQETLPPAKGGSVVRLIEPPSEPKTLVNDSPEEADKHRSSDQPPKSAHRYQVPPSIMRQVARTNAELTADHSRRDELEEVAGRRRAWSTYDSPLRDSRNSYEAWFREVLPESQPNMQQYIEETLGCDKQHTGLELGGPGTELFRGFSPGFFAASAGICLVDVRGRNVLEQSAQQKIKDEINHRVVEGNIIHPKTQDEALEQLGGSVDLVILRMYGGIGGIPDDPFFVGKMAARTYQQLAVNGLIFSEVPRGARPYIKDWVTRVKGEYPELDAQHRSLRGRDVVRIHKTPGAPAKLPLLGVRAVLRREHMRLYGTAY